MEEKPRTTPYPLRMPDELRAQLEGAAKNGSRSLHAEIVARLQATFRDPTPKHTFELVEDTAIASDEVLTPEQMELVREAATAAARHVVLHATSLRSTKFGAPSAIVTPPPEPKAKPPKKPSP